MMKASKSYGILLLLCIFFFLGTCSTRVLELSDRFLEVRTNGVWLVMFYAPWCGHCKNLEPVWNQVAQSLVDTDVRVGRIDCTRFVSVATEFSVAGFPTILFIKGHKTVEYRGDRQREEIVDFAKRMDGPAVRHFSTCDQFHALRKTKKAFFAFIDSPNLSAKEELKDNFTRLADEYQVMLTFCSAPVQCIAQMEGLAVPAEQSIYVCKDNSCFRYEEEVLELQEWVNRERFPAFQKITHGNLHQLMRTGKHLVMAVLEEDQLGGLALKMAEFRDVVEAIALNNKDIYHDHFVFGWLGNPDIANNIAIQTLQAPTLIVVNSQTYEHFFPAEDKDFKAPTPQSILELLDQVKNGTADALGGETFVYRVYRSFYGAKTSLFGMWQGNPVLTTVLLGLPIGLFSIICYTTCCTDILEAGDDEDEAENADERHQKRE